MKPLRIALILILAGLAIEIGGYTLIGGKWQNPTTTFYSATGEIGFYYVIENAMVVWNESGAPFRFAIRNEAADPCDHNDGKNGIGFATTQCGGIFGDDALALTLLRGSRANILGETDILFNPAYTWSIYNGVLRRTVVGGVSQTLHDLRRVAVHELGHALGLGHESSAPSIMTPTESNVEAPQTDDIIGAASIYSSGPATLNASAATCSGDLGTVTLYWNAAGVSDALIRSGSASGTAITGPLTPTGSVRTGASVANGLRLFLVSTGGQTLASTTVVTDCPAPSVGTASLTISSSSCEGSAGVVALVWSAPSPAYLSIRVGSPTGAALTGAIGATGIVRTGPWVNDGMQFFLVNSRGLTLASTRATVSCFTAGSAELTITSTTCAGNLGVATLMWNAPVSNSTVSIRVNSPSGTPLTGPMPTFGSIPTGPWVTDGMPFFLMNASGQTLASATASVACPLGSGPPQLAISAATCAGPYGVATVTWSAPGRSNLVIRVGSTSGTPLTGLIGGSGSTMTGPWMTNGMPFFLIDSSGTTLASANAVVNCPGS